MLYRYRNKVIFTKFTHPSVFNAPAQGVTVHCSLSAVTHAPFHASVLRPASQVGPMHKAAGMGKLVNAALLSLINEACVNVCCATLLLSQLVVPLVSAHKRGQRSSNPRGRACRPSGKGSGEGPCSGGFPLEFCNSSSAQ